MNGNMNLGSRIARLEKDGGENAQPKLHEYSADEKVVGTWIDGRPVYERTVEISDNRVVNGSFEIIVLENIDFLVSQNVTFRDVYQNGAKFILSNYAPTISGWTQGSLIYVNSNNNLIFRFDGAGGELKIFGVIQYTKTTDTATN